MKLSLNELQVDSYATQVSENELTDVKGGTSSWCHQLAISVISSVSGAITQSLMGAPGQDGQPGQSMTISTDKATIRVEGGVNVSIDSIGSNGTIHDIQYEGR